MASKKKIRKELIGAKITKGHVTIIMDDSEECKKTCTLLKLDVFEKKEKKDAKLDEGSE